MIKSFQIFEKRRKTPLVGDWVIISRYRSPAEIKFGIAGEDAQIGLYANRSARGVKDKQPYLVSLSPEKIPEKSLRKIFNKEYLNQYEWQIILNMAHVVRSGPDEIFFFSKDKKEVERELEKFMEDLELRKDAERYNL